LLFLLLHLVMLLAAVVLTLLAGAELASLPAHGWARGDDALAGACTLPRRHAASLLQADFDELYRDTEPVVLTLSHDNDALRAACARGSLLDKYGDLEVVLSSANTYSYVKQRLALRSYIEQHMAPPHATRSGRDTLYWFGDHNYSALAPLLELYQQPPLVPTSASVALSFGVAGTGSGVPFHVHGPGWSEALVGRKRWLLYPPNRKPPFDPDETSLLWMRRWLRGDAGIAAHGAPMECTLQPGEAIYFPSAWWHATLNVDEAVFISSFVNYAPPSDELRRH